MEIRYGDQILPERAFVEFLSDSGREASYFTDGTNWNTEPGDIVGNLLALREKWKSQTGRPAMPKGDAEALVERIEGMIAAGKVDRQQAEDAIATIRRDAGLLPLPIVVSEAEKMAMIRDGVLQEFFGQMSRLNCIPAVVLDGPKRTCKHQIVVLDTRDAPAIALCENCLKHLTEIEAIELKQRGHRFIRLEKASPVLTEVADRIRKNGHEFDVQKPIIVDNAG